MLISDKLILKGIASILSHNKIFYIYIYIYISIYIYIYIYLKASLVAQMVKRLSTMRKYLKISMNIHK